MSLSPCSMQLRPRSRLAQVFTQTGFRVEVKRLMGSSKGSPFADHCHRNGNIYSAEASDSFRIRPGKRLWDIAGSWNRRSCYRNPHCTDRSCDARDRVGSSRYISQARKTFPVVVYPDSRSVLRSYRSTNSTFGWPPNHVAHRASAVRDVI